MKTSRLSVILLAGVVMLSIPIFKPSPDHNTKGFATAAAAAGRKSKCSPTRDLEMDACAARMGFLGDHKFQVPRNSSSMEAFCGQLKDSIGCLQNYSRDCLQGMTKQILAGLLKRGKLQYQSICASDKSRQEFMQQMDCLSSSEKIAQFHSCMDASIVRFEFIRSGQVANENKLPTLCCSYQIFFADTSTTLDSLCGAGDSSAKTFVQKLVSGTTGDFLQLICDNHRTMDECRASEKTSKVIDKLEQLTRAGKSGQVKAKSKSLIPPLLDILDSSH